MRIGSWEPSPAIKGAAAGLLVGLVVAALVAIELGKTRADMKQTMWFERQVFVAGLRFVIDWDAREAYLLTYNKETGEDDYILLEQPERFTPDTIRTIDPKRIP